MKKTKRRLRCTIPVLFGFCLTLCLNLPPAHAKEPAFTGMVSAAHPLAAEAGRDILAQGGTAMDAAVAIQAVLGLVEPQSSGLAGGGFLLHYDAAQNWLTSWDGRETAPAQITPDVFVKNAGSIKGFIAAMTSAQAVGVPGIPALLEQAHGKFGKLDWASLFTPAIELARDGFAISPRLNALVSRDPFLPRHAAPRDYFYLPESRNAETPGKPTPKPVGTILKNPAYHATLTRLAEQGAASFYQGETGRLIVSELKKNDARSLLSQTDFAAYRMRERQPLCAPYRGYKVCSMGPPSSGGIALLQILGLLSPFDMRAEGASRLMSVHLFSEAVRLAFADRNHYVGDIDFVDVPVAALLDDAYLASRAKLISPDKAAQVFPPGAPLGGKLKHKRAANVTLAQPSTTHFTVLDRFGNAVSMTSSVESAFGSRLMVGGMMMNNQLTDFSFLPEKNGLAVANAVAPGKRPRSSMTPVMIFYPDGSLFAMLGSPGGPLIISYVAQTVVALIDWQLPMQAAIDLPRHAIGRHADGQFGVSLEAGTGLDSLAEDLRRMGHKVEQRRHHSGLHGIRLIFEKTANKTTNKKADGGADPRREGVVLTP